MQVDTVCGPCNFPGLVSPFLRTKSNFTFYLPKCEVRVMLRYEIAAGNDDGRSRLFLCLFNLPAACTVLRARDGVPRQGSAVVRRRARPCAGLAGESA